MSSISAISLCFLLYLFHYSVAIVARRKVVANADNSLRDIDYRTAYFEQPVDHFSYANQDTFQQRYLIADQFWDPSSGPVFFYTGNEGDIEMFCNNTGLMWDWAPEFKALLIFTEHRYYGKTLPYGKSSYQELSKLGYLSAEQALADFTDLIGHLKQTIHGFSDKPVIAFGGSYGGMLSAWFRIKYPYVIQGALAASAPMWMFGDLVPCGAFNQLVTKDFKRASANCAVNIRNSWDVINSLGKSEAGRKSLSEALSLCKPLSSEDDIGTLKMWLINAYTNLAMVDYPYAANFLEPLPAWPISVFCKPLNADKLTGNDLLNQLSAATRVYYNYTGDTQCLNIDQAQSPDLGDIGWDFQACTEMVMPICSDGEKDMFEPAPWIYEQYAAGCKKRWGTTPRPQWILEQFGGKDITTATNIIFSNGGLDPWSVGGVNSTLSPSLVAVFVPDGAHHLDLRGHNPADPDDVISVRAQEKSIVTGWIKEFHDGRKDDTKTDQILVDYAQLDIFMDSFGEDFQDAQVTDLSHWMSVSGTLICFVGVGALALVYMYLLLCQKPLRVVQDVENTKQTTHLAPAAKAEPLETKVPLVDQC